MIETKLFLPVAIGNPSGHELRVLRAPKRLAGVEESRDVGVASRAGGLKVRATPSETLAADLRNQNVGCETRPTAVSIRKGMYAPVVMPLDEANQSAGIEPAVTFHILRHTHGSHLAMAGVPMGVIAAQLGHADTRMTEKHHAHLAPSYVAQTIGATFPNLNLSSSCKVVPLRKLMAT